MIIVGATLLLVVVAAGCAVEAQDQPLAQGSVLMDTEWMLVSLSGDALVEGTEVTLRFGDTSVEGNGGCNTYGGSYATSDGSLSLSGVYWTEMACPEPEGVLEQEQAYFQALDAVAGYEVDGEQLGLLDENGNRILAYLASTADALVEQAMPTEVATEISLDCALEMADTTPVGEPVTLVFQLHNPTDRPLYVLAWYTPLEGIAGEILSITRDGTKLSYQGLLAKRDDPTRDEYVGIQPGETISAEADLGSGYDLTTPGSYQARFTAGLQDVTDDEALIPRRRDDHQPQALACNAVRFSVVPSTEPPAGFRRYIHGPSGIPLWVPDTWTIIEPGPHGGSTILQSYPQDKYIGGEVRQPGDTKCDLTVHPPETQMADVIQQVRSGPHTTIVSERETVLLSGRSGMRFEVESMGRALSMISEVNSRTVVLTCFGDLTQFDEIAVTLGLGEVH
jgi:heat shock protein HslJ